MVQDITDAKFEELTNNGLVLIDFWAPWCGPCRMQSPIIDDVSEELEDIATFYKMNVDEEPKTAAEFSIMSIPTMIIKKDGEVVEKLVGYHDKQRLIQIINQHHSN